MELNISIDITDKTEAAILKFAKAIDNLGADIAISQGDFQRAATQTIEMAKPEPKKEEPEEPAEKPAKVTEKPKEVKTDKSPDKEEKPAEKTEEKTEE